MLHGHVRRRRRRRASRGIAEGQCVQQIVVSPVGAKAPDGVPCAMHVPVPGATTATAAEAPALHAPAVTKWSRAAPHVASSKVVTSSAQVTPDGESHAQLQARESIAPE
jgi:hypothetical protein